MSTRHAIGGGKEEGALSYRDAQSFEVIAEANRDPTG